MEKIEQFLETLYADADANTYDLVDDDISFFHENGYLVLKNVLSNETIDIFETTEYTDHDNRVLKSAIDFYQDLWPTRAMITGDLILFLEFFYYNQNWFYSMDKNDQDMFLIRMKNALLPIWPDGTTGSAGKGYNAVWSKVQEARRESYPNKTVEDKQKNAPWYVYGSPRVAQCMWIGTALYSVLKAKMDKDDSDKLQVHTTKTEDEQVLTYDKLSLV